MSICTLYSVRPHSTSSIDPLHLCNSEPISHSIGIHIQYSISIITLQGLTLQLVWEHMHTILDLIKHILHWPIASLQSCSPFSCSVCTHTLCSILFIFYNALGLRLVREHMHTIYDLRKHILYWPITSLQSFCHSSCSAGIHTIWNILFISCKALTLWLVREHTNTIQDPIKYILSLIYYISAKCWPISLFKKMYTHVRCNNVPPSLINVFLKLWPIGSSDSIHIHTLCSVSIISLQIGPLAGPAA